MYIISEAITIILSSAVKVYGESNINRITEWGEHFKQIEVDLYRTNVNRLYIGAVPNPHLHLTSWPGSLKSRSLVSCCHAAMWLLIICFLLADSQNTEVGSASLAIHMYKIMNEYIVTCIHA